MSQQDVVLLLGSNLGDREKNLELAIKLLETKVGKIKKKTKILKTTAVEFVSYNFFYNFALVMQTDLSPIHLLKLIKMIEVELGRRYDSSENGCYGDRMIDIDIVLYSKLRYKNKNLEIPHRKHLYEREFSKILLNEIRTL